MLTRKPSRATKPAPLARIAQQIVSNCIPKGSMRAEEIRWHQPSRKARLGEIKNGILAPLGAAGGVSEPGGEQALFEPPGPGRGGLG